MKTLNDGIAGYLEHLGSLNYSPKTVKGIGKDLAIFARFLSDEGVADAQSIGRNHAGGWRRHAMSQRNAEGLPLAAGTVNNRMKNARGFLSYLAKKGIVPPSLPDDMQYVREPSPLPSSVLTHAQFKAIAESIDTTDAWGFQSRTMLELMYSSGLRASEIIGLKIRDVDFEGGVAKIMGKGRKERMVPVGRTALKFLENFVRGVRPFLLKSDTDSLFVSHAGKAMAYRTFLALVHRNCNGGEVNVTPHTFRRSCATEMLRADANMYHLKDFLGHESLDTLKHYAKLTIVDLKRTHARCHPRERDDRDGG